LFDIPIEYEEFFVLDKSMRVIRRLPEANRPDPDLVKEVKRITGLCGSRHPLSVTLGKGCGLIYFEPLVTGGENLSDVDSLYCIAEKIRENLAGDIS